GGEFDERLGHRPGQGPGGDVDDAVAHVVLAAHAREAVAPAGEGPRVRDVAETRARSVAGLELKQLSHDRPPWAGERAGDGGRVAGFDLRRARSRRDDAVRSAARR